MKIVDDEKGAIVYRQNWASFYISAIFGIPVLMVFFCLGGKILADNRFPAAGGWMLLLFCHLPIICVGHMIWNPLRYRVTLYRDRVEWLDNGFSRRSVLVSQIAKIENGFDNVELLLRATHDLRDREQIPKTRFGTSRDIVDFIAELRARLPGDASQTE